MDEDEQQLQDVLTIPAVLADIQGGGCGRDAGHVNSGFRDEVIDFEQLDRYLSGSGDEDGTLSSMLPDVEIEREGSLTSGTGSSISQLDHHHHQQQQRMQPHPTLTHHHHQQQQHQQQHLIPTPIQCALPDSPPDSGSEPPLSPLESVRGGISSGVILNTGYMATRPPVTYVDPAHMSCHASQHRTQEAVAASHMYVHTTGGRMMYQQGVSPLSGVPLSQQHQIPQQKPSHMPPVHIPSPQMQNNQLYHSPYNSVNNVSVTCKKRKHANDSASPDQMRPCSVASSNTTASIHVKSEPSGCEMSESVHDLHETSSQYDSQPDSSYSSNCAENSKSGSQITFQSYQVAAASLLDSNMKEILKPIGFIVEADKGFNFSHADESYVCQKKNHFQVTTHIDLGISPPPQHIRTPDGLARKVQMYYLHLYGVHAESQSQTIQVEQSQADRSKRPFHPHRIWSPGSDGVGVEGTKKVTVGRLHFAETTSNNMRKKGKPNPDQRYFLLVVAMHAHTTDNQSYPIIASASDKIIVRASNPGQFESDIDVMWQKGANDSSVVHWGHVGVNTDRPTDAMVVHGNLQVTGQIVNPSDARAKNIVGEVDSKKQLDNVSQMKIYKFRYHQNYAKQARLDAVSGTGVIAQEMREILPDAVGVSGDFMLANGEVIDHFLIVDKDRIFMENVGAVKELCKVTGKLEDRIDELEKLKRKISRRHDSLRSTTSTITTASSQGSASGGYSHGKTKMMGKVGTLRDSSCSGRDGGRGMGGSRTRKMGGGGLCGNKLIQMITIVLVIIMALCLVTMSTLYVMQWHQGKHGDDTDDAYNQPFGSPGYTTHRTTLVTQYFTKTSVMTRRPTSTASTQRMTIDTLETTTSPTKQPTTAPAKPLTTTTPRPTTTTPAGELTRQSATTPLTTSATIVTSNINFAIATSNSVSMPSLLGESHPSTSPVTTNLPPIKPSSCTKSVCTAYCMKCTSGPAKVHQPTENGGSNNGSPPLRPGTRNSSRIVAASNAESGGVVRQRARNIERRVGTLQRGGGGHVRITAIGGLDELPSLLKTGQSASHLSANDAAVGPYPTQGQPKYHQSLSRRKRRNREEGLPGYVENVKISQYNMTISNKKYCTNEECMQEDSSNLSYAIPISKYVPIVYLTLQFTLLESAEVHLCKTNEFGECSGPVDGRSEPQRNFDDTTPTDQQIKKPFFLPIGQFEESFYKFRLSEIEDTLQVCRSDTPSNDDFIEFNFHFYRLCDG